MPKELPNITGWEAAEKANAEGFCCGYIDGRPVFFIESERQREAAHKWAKANYGRTYAVYGSQGRQEVHTEDETDIEG